MRDYKNCLKLDQVNFFLILREKKFKYSKMTDINII